LGVGLANTHVSKVNISDNGLTDDGSAEMINGLTKTARELISSHNSIGPKSVIMLSAKFAETNLRVVKLENASLSNSAVSQLLLSLIRCDKQSILKELSLA